MKNSTQKKAPAPFNAQAFAEAGFAEARHEAVIVALFGTITKATYQPARAEFVAGHVAAALSKAEKLEIDTLAKARTIVGTKGAAKNDEGKFIVSPGRRTPQQETLVNSADRAWSRFCDKAGIEKPKKGKKGKRKAQASKVNEPKAPAQEETKAPAQAPVDVFAIGKVKAPADLVAPAHRIKEAILSLIAAVKPLKVSDELDHATAQALAWANKVETLLGKAKGK